MRFCVGTDFTKLQMAAFLHSLVTKYRFDIIISLKSLFFQLCKNTKADFDSGS